MMNSKKVLFYAYARLFLEKYPLRNNRIVPVASFPKSGNTWVRFVIANYINKLLDLDIDIDFTNLFNLVPETRGVNDISKALVVSGLALPVKTHALPPISSFYDRSVLIIRRPEDVMVSYKHYMEGAHGVRFETLESFISSAKYGVEQWLLINKSWIRKGAFVVEYESLVSNPAANFESIIESIGLPLDRCKLESSIEVSSKKTMRKKLAVSGDPYNQNGYQFVRESNEKKEVDLVLARRIIKEILISKGLYNQYFELGYEF